MTFLAGLTRKAVCALGVFLIDLTFAVGVQADASMQLIAGDLSPYATLKNNQPEGLGVDVLREMAARLGQPATVSVMPYRRAFLNARRQPNVLMTPVARVAAREGTLRWAMHYIDDLFFYVTRSGSVPMTHNNARLRGDIAVLGGSAPLAELQRAGIRNFQQQTTDTVNIQMLQSGRVDGWFTSAILLGAAFKANPQLHREDFVIGPVQSRHCVYIIASKNTSDASLQPWLRAFADVERDGTLKRLIERHLSEALARRVMPVGEYACEPAKRVEQAL